MIIRIENMMNTAYKVAKKSIIWLFLFLGLMVSLPVFSQKKNREFEKLIRKYDVTSVLQTKNGKPEDFWRQLSQNHQGLLAYINALEHGKKTALKAENDISMALGLIEHEYNQLYVYTGDTIANYTREISEGILGIDANKIRIHIAYGSIPNAFCTPRGDIYIYTSLLERVDYDWRMLYGICAHEVAHYYLRHSARQKWADEKRAKKNRIMAGIAIGLNAVAEVTNAYVAGYTGNKYESHFAETYQNILYNAQYDNQMFHFKYSREEELEADIIAHRFLEFVGIDPTYYALALYSLGTENDNYYSDWSDHPTISYRVSFLNYLKDKYPLSNDSE